MKSILIKKTSDPWEVNYEDNHNGVIGIQVNGVTEVDYNNEKEYMRKVTEKTLAKYFKDFEYSDITILVEPDEIVAIDIRV